MRLTVFSARRLHRKSLHLALVLGLAACSVPRESDHLKDRCATWKDDVQPLVTERCSRCHSGGQPAGNYDLSSYHGLLSGGLDDQANAVAGDRDSLLLSELRVPTTSGHDDAQDVEAVLENWVVDCRLAYFTSSIHEPGIQNPAEPDQFHGKVLRSRSWDFGLCAQCHGDDFSGGKSGVSCKKCHTQGPTDCQTCHKKTVKQGAHAVHLNGGVLGKALDCSECHRKPSNYRDPGHIFLEDGSVDPAPADVNFGALAAHTPAGATRTGPPTYNAESATCSNIYCHGGTFTDSASQLPQPVWTSQRLVSQDCTRCHGAPPSNHANNDCATCHGRVTDGRGRILNASMHLDGYVDLGDGSGSCSACHGGPEAFSPFRDLAGNTLTSSLGVGAHQVHLEGPHRLSGALQCAHCHQTPATVTDPGHVDSARPAEVFPSAISSSSPAFARGATPAWNRDNATCSNVGCHGGSSSAEGAVVRWINPSDDAIACGMCHGVPPQDARHNTSMTLQSCATCHPQTVDAFGNILVTGEGRNRTSTHMNGVVNAQP